ncbi:unnamed protein product, partial [Discosporangium mesarthrocarpum]
MLSVDLPSSVRHTHGGVISPRRGNSPTRRATSPRGGYPGVHSPGSSPSTAALLRVTSPKATSRRGSQQGSELWGGQMKPGHGSSHSHNPRTGSGGSESSGEGAHRHHTERRPRTEHRHSHHHRHSLKTKREARISSSPVS